MTFKHKLSCRLALMRDIAVAGTVTLAACELPTRPPEPVPPGTPVQVVVSPLTVVLPPSQTTDLVAVALTSTGDTAATAMIWSATGGAVIDTSTNGGLHRGRYRAPTTPGQYKVIARAQTGGAADTAAVTVNPVPVATVAVTPATAGVTVGGTQQFTAVALDSAGNPLAGRVITWSSVDPAVATVNSTGLAAGVSAGSATIVATSEGKTGTAAVTVSLAPVASVTVSPASATIVNGTTTQLAAVLKDAAGTTLTGRVVTWSSNNASVASVNGSGLVTAGGVGSATITVTSEGQSGTAAITVTTVPVASVTVTPATASLVVGATQQLSAVTKDAAGATLTGRVVTWATSNAAVATVNGSGLVTAAGAGSATITATSEGKSGTAAITVTLIPVATVTVTPATANVLVGATQQLSAVTKDASGATLTGRVVTWASSNTTVATVTTTGLVTGRAAGAATITGTSEGQSGTAAITVATVPVASVTVSPASASLSVGATQQLSAVTRDAGGATLTGRIVSWASNNSLVATVSGSGLVAAVAAGSATITATSEGINGTATITVTTPPPPPSGPLAAFPGAEGFGTTTAAGRGGQVIRVTNLNDAGPGSLRAALTTTGPRIVVFDVSGQIDLVTEIEVGDNGASAWDFLTVAGQTAPSPGITVNGTISVRAHDVVFQHIRIRPGSQGTADGLRIDNPASRVVIDHVSASWAMDENMSVVGGASNVTISNCILSEALNGGKAILITVSSRVMVRHCLEAHTRDRHPEVAGSDVVWLNNLQYNIGNGSLGPNNPPQAIWHASGAYGGNVARCTVIGNRYKQGPTGHNGFRLLFHETLPAGSSCYVSDNVYPAAMEIENGSGIVLVSAPPTPLPSPLTVLTNGAVEAFVLVNAGARPADRDAVDVRLVNDVLNGTGSSLITNESQVGGYPTLALNTRTLALPANPNGDDDGDGYTNLEELLHALAACVEGRSANVAQCRAWAVIP